MSNARNIASIAGEDVLNASNQVVPVYACRAWVNFNGTLDENENIDGSLTTGENVYIRDAGNVSSVYFNGTGDYTINFATPMPDANYAPVCLNQSNGLVYDGSIIKDGVSLATSSIRVFNCKVTDGTARNPLILSVAIFR